MPRMNEDLKRALRYRSALDRWYYRMFAAGRAGRPFNERRPEPEDVR